MECAISYANMSICKCKSIRINDHWTYHSGPDQGDSFTLARFDGAKIPAKDPSHRVHLLPMGRVHSAFPIRDDIEVQRLPFVTPDAIGDGQICWDLILNRRIIANRNCSSPKIKPMSLSRGTRTMNFVAHRLPSVRRLMSRTKQTSRYCNIL